MRGSTSIAIVLALSGCGNGDDGSIVLDGAELGPSTDTSSGSGSATSTSGSTDATSSATGSSTGAVDESGSAGSTGGGPFLCTPMPERLRTDTEVEPEPTLPAAPPAGGTVVDPTFGTTILRVTDESDGAACVNPYSYWPSFNLDSTRMIVMCDGSGVRVDFDPVAFAIEGRAPLFAAAPPAGGAPTVEDAIWSALERDTIFAHAGSVLLAYDVATDDWTLVHDFADDFGPGAIRQMSRSMDDDVFAFTKQDENYDVVGYAAWRSSTATVLLDEDTAALDEVQVDKTGRWLVVKTGMSGAGAVEVRVADLESGTFADLVDDGPDFSPGHSDNGAGVVLGADNWNNRVTWRELVTPHVHIAALDLPDWSQDFHVSMLADDEQWATLSLYWSNDLESTGLWRDEIVQIATDGSQTVRRLAHHGSDFPATGDYWDSPRGNASRDGCFVAFTSNWGASGRRDVFVVSTAH